MDSKYVCKIDTEYGEYYGAESVFEDVVRIYGGSCLDWSGDNERDGFLYCTLFIDSRFLKVLVAELQSVSFYWEIFG